MQMIEEFYAPKLRAEMNIGLLHSRRGNATCQAELELGERRTWRERLVHEDPAEQAADMRLIRARKRVGERIRIS